MTFLFNVTIGRDDMGSGFHTKILFMQDSLDIKEFQKRFMRRIMPCQLIIEEKKISINFKKADQ